MGIKPEQRCGQRRVLDWTVEHLKTARRGSPDEAGRVEHVRSGEKAEDIGSLAAGRAWIVSLLLISCVTSGASDHLSVP